MKKSIPKKCDQCGAPIRWDKFTAFVTCEYCGARTEVKTTQLRKNSFNDKISKISSPITTKAKEITKFCIDKQTLLSDK